MAFSVAAVAVPTQAVVASTSAVCSAQRAAPAAPVTAPTSVARFQAASKARFGVAVRKQTVEFASPLKLRAVEVVASSEFKDAGETQTLESFFADTGAKLAAGLTLLLATTPLPALAEEEEVTTPVFTPLLDGATQFIHPLLMYGLFGASIYAGYLGWKVRETRSAKGEEKSKLLKGKYSDRHAKLGSIIQGAMVSGTALGMLVTYNNNGKLFPGSHLYSGVLMAALIATAGALTPWMKEGKDWARNLHIALNSTMVLLFVSEVATGTEIVQFLLGLK
eukprot:tig00000692_g3229.t1